MSEEGKGRKRRETPDRLHGRPMSRAEWEYLRWRKFTWLPGEMEITVAGKRREGQTNNHDEST